MKTEVYSWRVSSELKSDLEREARLRHAPVSAVLEEAVRTWLNRPSDPDNEVEQRKLHRAAAESFGTIAGNDKSRSENAGRLVRERLRRRNVR